jgi:AcrR family transcriptional regulator
MLERGVNEENLSLRALAREVGVSAMTPYLHFPNKAALLLAVYEARFGELGEALGSASAQLAKPADQLRAWTEVYLNFGRGSPGHYRVLFSAGVAPRPMEGRLPGQRLFDRLVELVGQVLADVDAPAFGNRAPTRVAIGLWCGLHGIVTLPSSNPAFDWPPSAELVDDLLATWVGVLPSPPALTSATLRETDAADQLPERSHGQGRLHDDDHDRR